LIAFAGEKQGNTPSVRWLVSADKAAGQDKEDNLNLILVCTSKELTKII